MKKLFSLVVLASLASCLQAQQDISLPIPKTTGGKPLMDVLNNRQSSREFGTKAIDQQTLSNLLWAAWGFNRADKRTAPSARNKQEYEVYVVLQQGAYLYQAKENKLQWVASGDIRKLCGTQDFVATAPLNLVFVYNKELAPDSKYAYADCGYISQNVYLFCTSEGLNTVVRGLIPVAELSKALKLPAHKEIVLSQTVGYPK